MLEMMPGLCDTYSLQDAAFELDFARIEWNSHRSFICTRRAITCTRRAYNLDANAHLLTLLRGL
jgi:hypothetical protein